jgi:hypothetical protein
LRRRPRALDAAPFDGTVESAWHIKVGAVLTSPQGVIAFAAFYAASIAEVALGLSVAASPNTNLGGTYKPWTLAEAFSVAETFIYVFFVSRSDAIRSECLNRLNVSTLTAALVGLLTVFHWTMGTKLLEVQRRVVWSGGISLVGVLWRFLTVNRQIDKGEIGRHV